MEGTGRFQLSEARRQLGLLNLSKTISAERLRRLSLFLEAFLGLPVVHSAANPSLSMKATKRKASIIDRKQGVSFPLTVFKNGCVDVFSVFDVLVEYVSENDFNLLAITDHPLGEVVSEEDEEEEISEVLGRACGDRVAVVQCYKEVTDLELFATIAHELLHTMGFDHTTYFRCLMNPSCFDDEWIFLSPHNLKKLKLFLEEGANTGFIRCRYETLERIWWDVFKAKTPDEHRHYVWLREKIALLNTIT